MSHRQSRCMLRLTGDRWSLLDLAERESPALSGPWSPADPAAVLEDLARDLAERQISPGPLLISLDSSLCLATQFTATSARQLRQREALLFQLEETLPVSAEEIVADFIVRQREVFAVAADVAVLEPLVAELAREGFAIEAIVPEVALAAEEHQRSGTWPVRHGALWPEETQFELVTFENRKIATWQRLPPEPEAVVQACRARELLARDALPLALYGAPELAAQVQARCAAEWLPTTAETPSPSLTSQAAATAVRVLDGQIDPPLQLLRGSLAASIARRNPLASDWRLVQAAVALLLVALSITQFRSLQDAEQELASHVARQADVYRELYPDKPVPVGIQARMESELRRLRGVRGDSAELPATTEALRVVEKVLAALPADMRFRLLEVRVESGRLSLSGEVRSHGDADQIAAALRRQGFKVSSPSTQQLPQQGVDFRLTAEFAPAQEKSV